MSFLVPPTVKMDPIMDVIKNSEEPEWLEKPLIGKLRLWQILFLCLAGVTTLSKFITCLT